MNLILLFCTLLFLVIYTYFLYPFILWLISNRYKLHKTQTNYNIKLDFLIAAYNEEKVISWKIENTIKALKKFKNAKIWIVSDGSTDRTIEIVKKYSSKNSIVNLIELKNQVNHRLST